MELGDPEGDVGQVAIMAGSIDSLIVHSSVLSAYNSSAVIIGVYSEY